MTTHTFLLTTFVLAAGAGSAFAQTPAPAPVPRSATPPPAAAPAAVVAPTPRAGQAVNVRVDLTITEQHGTATPSKKVVSIVVADGQTGYIRSQSDVFAVANQMPLNIDAEPTLLADGKIRLRFNVQYDLPATYETQSGSNPPRGTVTKTQLHDNMAVVLESGKAITAAQSADPVGDRQMTVEVKATILK